MPTRTSTVTSSVCSAPDEILHGSQGTSADVQRLREPPSPDLAALCIARFIGRQGRGRAQTEVSLIVFSKRREPHRVPRGNSTLGRRIKHREFRISLVVAQPRIGERWIERHRAGKAHRVDTSLLDRVSRLIPCLESSCRHDWNGRRLFRALCKVSEIGPRRRPAVGTRCCTWKVRSSADVDKVDRRPVEHVNHLPGIVFRKASHQSVRRVDLDADRERHANGLPDGVYHVVNDAEPSFDRAAIGIRPSIEQR